MRSCNITRRLSTALLACVKSLERLCVLLVVTMESWQTCLGPCMKQSYARDLNVTLKLTVIWWYEDVYIMRKNIYVEPAGCMLACAFQVMPWICLTSE